MSTDVRIISVPSLTPYLPNTLPNIPRTPQSSSDAYTKVGIWIPVTDPLRARTFYSTVFSWKCQETSNPLALEGIKETYFFTKGGALYGCFFLADKSITQQSLDASIGVHNIFSVKDIEETLELIENNGGKRHAGKTSIGVSGFVARFVDTEGNIMGIYASN